jgi:hypothetical protein
MKGAMIVTTASTGTAVTAAATDGPGWVTIACFGVSLCMLVVQLIRLHYFKRESDIKYKIAQHDLLERQEGAELKNRRAGDQSASPK